MPSTTGSGLPKCLIHGFSGLPNRGLPHVEAQQVIMQVCISPHFGVICERLLPADEAFPLIGSLLTRRRFRCKADSSVLSACCPQTPVPQSPTAPRKRAVSAINVAMQQVPAEIATAFERRLGRGPVPAPQRPDAHKWVRFYLHFCHKYCHSPASPNTLRPFLTKLASLRSLRGISGESPGSLAVAPLIPD